MAAASKPYLLLSFTIFIICTFIISLTKATKLGFTVELIHRDSPKSPFYNNTAPLTPFQQVYNALRRSIKRVNHFYPKAQVSDDDADSELIYTTGEYLMAYSLGNPPIQTFGIADTGSDLVWLQCAPCFECYKQTIPLFDESKSITYRNYNCNSKQCSSVRPSVDNTYCDVVYTCQYHVTYGDGSVSSGTIASDTLTLGSTNGGHVAFPKILFGCGHQSDGIFFAQTSGIVGLGRGSISLVSQMGSSVESKFSYCMAPLFSDKSSKLHFGQNAIVAGSGTVSTPIVSRDPDNFYYLTLEGMSVGDKRIEFTGDDGSVEEGNIIIDSGTHLTLLPEDFYSELESEVAAQIQLDRTGDPDKLLSLCYLSENIKSVGAPIITAHFKGADVPLNPINTFLVVTTGVVCFAFRAASDAVYGNLVQMNFLVGYDLQNNLVSFKPTDCTMP